MLNRIERSVWFERSFGRDRNVGCQWRFRNKWSFWRERSFRNKWSFRRERSIGREWQFRRQRCVGSHWFVRSNCLHTNRASNLDYQHRRHHAARIPDRDFEHWFKSMVVRRSE